MATKQGTKQSGGKTPQRGRPPKSSNKNNNTSKKNSTYYKEEAKRKKVYHDEITLTGSLVISLLLILSNFNMSGQVGEFIKNISFGLIGFIAYIIPFLIFFGVAFSIANRGNRSARGKIYSFVGLLVILTALIQLSVTTYSSTKTIKDMYLYSAKEKNGGGVVGGIISKMLVPAFGTVGTIVILLALCLILLMFLTGKALLTVLGKKGEDYLIERKERRILEEEEYEARIESGLVEKRKARTVDLKKKENISADSSGDKLLVKDDSVKNTTESSSNIFDKKSMKKKKKSDIQSSSDMKEITNESSAPMEISQVESQYHSILEEKFGRKIDITTGEIIEDKVPFPVNNSTFDSSHIDSDINKLLKAAEGEEHTPSLTGAEFEIHMSSIEEEFSSGDSMIEENIDIQLPTYAAMDLDEVVEENNGSSLLPGKEFSHMKDSINSTQDKKSNDTNLVENTLQEIAINEVLVEYKFPPLDLLSSPKQGGKGMNEKDLKETAKKLQSTLESFGVRVTITNVSCGPSVTRYELQPEQGVKVSRITGLADDIKLNLAAADVRIEAPIPGKAAVGIEVPNKTNTMVTFRELIDSKDFNGHSSNIAFAVGKDIGGQTIVTDIGKMPHLLIAGATGSGKSVCINTLIMSILYKANPEDVRMIMIDPKVVELSVYNGIPHLLIPVVTDPKKASAALNWAVVEMTERYNKFAELGVRDINGYNEKIKTVEEYKDERYKKLPQIVIIVDELADLMMVAPGEVEDAICRLAQMARAAGLHLIIATQRPSVNVITGLIKANVPSRIAFSVSSAIDSRTIIDGAGAEKLLGKGDMLFFPSGYPKPVRVQGAFVSDKEVSSVVEFLKTQNSKPSYSDEITNQITSSASIDSGGSTGNDRDEYFIEAGKFIIEKDKASIGMLQRVYKIGFNRAARIMDQLSEAGVVGPEEGTKPRKVIMSLEEFETYVDEYV